jgi:hypothetical protein
MLIDMKLRLSEDLLNQAQNKATREERSLSALIEDALRRFLEETPKPIAKSLVLYKRWRISSISSGSILDDPRRLGYFQRKRSRAGAVSESSIERDEDMAAVGGARQMQCIRRRKFQQGIASEVRRKGAGRWRKREALRFA